MRSRTTDSAEQGATRLGAVTALTLLPPIARRALGVGGLLIVLGGLFGMHGLSTHGVDALDATAHGGMITHTAVPVLHEVVTNGASETAAAVVSVSPIPFSSDRHAGDMCLAVLVGLLLALLLLRYRRSGFREVPFMVASPRQGPTCRARAPDPPCLIALSVQRC